MNTAHRFAHLLNAPTSLRLACAATLLLAAGTLGGCSSSAKKPAMKTAANTSTPANGQMSLDMYDGSSYQQLSVVRGQKFSVRLPTHCGSHYNWRLAPESAESKFLTLTDRKSQQVEQGESSVIDSPSWDVFTFRANRTGEVELQFVYDRPFMSEITSSREFAMNVAIDKPLKGQTIQHASVTIE